MKSPVGRSADVPDAQIRHRGATTRLAIARRLPWPYVMATLGAVAIVSVVLARLDASWRNPAILTIVPAAAAWVVRRKSLLATLYLTQVAIYFGLSWLLLRQNRPPLLVAVVVLWALGIMIGTLASRARTTTPAGKKWDAPEWPHFVLTAGLLAVQFGLIISGRMGIRAQLTLGLTTPTGPLGILATAAPVVTLMLLMSALGSQRRVTVAALLAALQAVTLSLTGFRGAAVTFLIAALVAAMMTLPKVSPWRRPQRMAIGTVVMTAAVVAGFVIGAHVKNNVATELGRTSRGTQLFGLDQAVPAIAGRLDLGLSLEKAVARRDDPVVERAASWTAQIPVFVPRFLWRDKPIIDYGQRVSVAVYGLRYGQSSSTLTTVGDTLVNFKIPGVLIVSMLLGLALSLTERQIRRGTSLLSLGLAAVTSMAITVHEVPLLITGAGLIRDLLVASVLWLACSFLYRRAGKGGAVVNPSRPTPAAPDRPATRGVTEDIA